MPQHKMIGRSLYFADIIDGEVEIQEVYVRNVNESDDVLILSENVRVLGLVNVVFVDSPDVVFTKLVATGRLLSRLEEKRRSLIAQVHLIVKDCDAVLKYIYEGNLNEPEPHFNMKENPGE